MAAFGYLIYLLRVNQPHRAKELQRLSAAGDNDDDLLDLIEKNLVALGSGYQHEPRTAEGYRVKLIDRRGRSLFVRLNKGPEGAPGETYNVETEESIETTEKQAQLSGLRALFVIPEDSYYGLLFVERVGVRHLKENRASRPTTCSRYSLHGRPVRRRCCRRTRRPVVTRAGTGRPRRGRHLCCPWTARRCCDARRPR